MDIQEDTTTTEEGTVHSPTKLDEDHQREGVSDDYEDDIDE